MKSALPETKYIFDELLNEEQKDKIEIFLDGLSEGKEQYETDIIWHMDQGIGGIGGYCMPSNPIKNPFPGGLDRELFRPLQYARSEIDISDIRISSRHVVHFSGMHLEAVFRLFLKSKKALGKLRLNNSTLGKAIYEIEKMNVIDVKLIGVLFKFVDLYNKAKHEVNMFEERARLFTPSDAIVCYFCARIIGQMILEKIEYPTSQGIYEINNEPLNL